MRTRRYFLEKDCRNARHPHSRILRESITRSCGDVIRNKIRNYRLQSGRCLMTRPPDHLLPWFGAENGLPRRNPRPASADRRRAAAPRRPSPPESRSSARILASKSRSCASIRASAGKSTSRPGSSRKTESPGGLLPRSSWYASWMDDRSGEPKKPDRKNDIQKFRRKNPCSATTGYGALPPVQKLPYLLGRPAGLFPLPGEFNLACRERPAAESAAVGILHHGIDLP